VSALFGPAQTHCCASATNENGILHEPSTRTKFLYDGQNIVQEIESGVPSANILEGGIDEYFTRTDPVGTEEFLTDAQQNTIALADSSGVLHTRYSYEPFGNTSSVGSSSSNTFQFVGRENDGTGLYFYRSRYYSPVLERFISEDPVEYVGGFNFYSYVGGDPVNRVDPLGLCWIYKQSTGSISSDRGGIVVTIGSGYSGKGAGLNNPNYQDVGGRGADIYDPANAGPLPQGTYTIGPQKDNVTHTGVKLLRSMRLYPDPSNEMFGRAGFLIHGSNDPRYRNASEGCIVLPPDVRNVIGKSDDHCLKVVP
jgi:RHS repeat-associated protein